MLLKIIELLPAIAFFVSYKITSDLILATSVIVLSCIVGMALQYAIAKTLSRMQIFVTIAVIVFGLPTILLKDPEIIKWKVTVVNLVLAMMIAICQYVLKRNPFGYLFGRELNLPDHIWLKMSTSWMIFFILIAGLNVIIAFYLPLLFNIDAKMAEDLWVDYKTFGNAILNTVFAISCCVYLFYKYPEALEEIKKGQ